MPVDPGVLDANVLAYASNADAPHYPVSRALLEEARDPAATLFVTPQIVSEFYSVITNPRRVAVASPPAVAVQVITAILALPGIVVLPITARAVSALLDLLRRRPVTGQDVFDLQIVATMTANNVKRIYTFNAADFQAFPELTVTVPGTS